MLHSLKQNDPPSSNLTQSIRTTLLYLTRLLILGVGLGTLTGTALSLVNFEERNLSIINSLESTAIKDDSTPSLVDDLGEELLSLNQKIRDLTAKYPQLDARAFFIDLDNYAYVNFQGDTPISAASTIKIPILVAFFQDVDAGKIYLDELLTMEEKHRAGGSGEMQYLGSGREFTALKIALNMIVTSDNTATNMLIERLGGAEALNQRFQAWGLKSTVIRDILPDLEGKNTTSPQDLVFLLGEVNAGKLISLRSRDRLLDIMTATKNNSLIPQGLEGDATVAHKTGDIGSVLADGGIIDIPSGKRYLAAIMVKRPHNDPQARTLIQEISRTAYQHFKWYTSRPLPPTQ
ncbi:serine hydrolase [Gloeocapsa sp. PCC 73106]|uniref:serine hydrolase n=1 Tax=Gloeocapsa sp. PCC 73106 TaxID=102232 RepID=UPI0002AC11E7|nr:serine hydrolase [Gloeocapsa sp. PCC 73106]ELR98907.1 beta-lactamase class A [Gloeocapsa sp. PCC 73106]